MEDYSFSCPMRPPLLESTAADDSLRVKCNTSLVVSVNDSPVEPNLCRDSPVEQYTYDAFGFDNVKHSGSNVVGVDDLESFFKHECETEHIGGTHPHPMSYASNMHSDPMSYASNVHSETWLSGGIELCTAIKHDAVSMSCVSNLTPPHSNLVSLGTSSLLSPDEMPKRNNVSKGTSHYERTAKDISIQYPQNQLSPQHESSDGKQSLDKRCSLARAETLYASGSVGIIKPTAVLPLSRASKVAMYQLGSSVKSPVIRSRFDPVTNRFEEIVPSISTFDISDLEDRTLQQQQQEETCT